jgi:serine/threonine protein kinase
VDRLMAEKKKKNAPKKNAPKKKAAKKPRLEKFSLEEGDRLLGRYEVVHQLGKGWESEVWLVRERATGVARAAKLFFPQRNRGDRAARAFARKLHRLQGCPSVVQYIGYEQVFLDGQMITLLLSEYVQGGALYNFLKQQPKKRLEVFDALHLLREMADALATVHQRGEYHGDLHEENVIVERYGLGFNVKLLDPMRLGRRRQDYVHDDLVDLVHLYVEALGGKERYLKLPEDRRGIVGSARRDRVLARYRSAAALRDHLDHYRWD